MSSLKGDCRTLQRRLKALGVVPPAPDGQKPSPDAMKPGHYYVVVAPLGLAAYVARLRAACAVAEQSWQPNAHLHAVLAAARDAANVDVGAVAHGGVPARPAFGNPGHLRVLFFLLQQVAPRPAEKKAHAAAEAIVVGMLNPGLRSKAQLRALQQVVLTSKASPLARFATEGAFRSLQASPVDPMTRRAAEAAVKEVEHPRRGAFLKALDAVLLREDLAAVLDGRFDEGLVDEVLFRAAEGGRTTHWLGRLKGGKHVLVWKVKGRFHVVHGEKDDVLASVPDAHMRAAITAVR